MANPMVKWGNWYTAYATMIAAILATLLSGVHQKLGRSIIKQSPALLTDYARLGNSLLNSCSSCFLCLVIQWEPWCHMVHRAALPAWRKNRVLHYCTDCNLLSSNQSLFGGSGYALARFKAKSWINRNLAMNNVNLVTTLNSHALNREIYPIIYPLRIMCDHSRLCSSFTQTLRQRPERTLPTMLRWHPSSVNLVGIRIRLYVSTVYSECHWSTFTGNRKHQLFTRI